MGTFVDDFERADGSLGGNWSDPSGLASISGGYVISSGYSYCYNTTLSDNGRQSSEVTVAYVAHASRYAGPAVKFPGGGSDCYYFYLMGTAGSVTAYLGRRLGAANATLASQALGYNPNPFITLYLEWDNGHLIGKVDGTTVCQADDSTHANGVYAGLAQYSNSSKIGQVTIVAGAAVQLTVTPDVIGNYGDPSDLVFTGTNTAWSSGTPGTPSFTCNHGTITAQTINSATDADVTFDPGDYLGAVTFTDPSTGATDTVIVTSDPNIVPPGGGQFSAEAVAYIERSAIAQTDPTILNEETALSIEGAVGEVRGTLGWFWRQLANIVDPEAPDPPSGGYLDLLWKITNNRNEQTDYAWNQARDSSLKEDTEGLLTHLEQLRTGSELSLQDVIDTLGGTPFTDHVSLVTQFSGEIYTAKTDILDQLAVVQGDEISTVAGLRLHVEALRTVNEYTLGDVLAAIAAIPTGEVDLQPVLDAISALSDQLTSSTTTLTGDIADVDSLLTTVSTALGLVAGDVTSIASAVAQILQIVSELQAAAAVPHLPVWPGLSNVTLGEPVALSDGLTLTGPMHGLLFTMTGNPPNAGRYLFGSVKSWTHVGAVMFKADIDYYERPESIGIDTHIVIPRTMEEAAAAILRINQGFTGTVRTWLRNA